MEFLHPEINLARQTFQTIYTYANACHVLQLFCCKNMTCINLISLFNLFKHISVVPNRLSVVKVSSLLLEMEVATCQAEFHH